MTDQHLNLTALAEKFYLQVCELETLERELRDRVSTLLESPSLRPGLRADLEHHLEDAEAQIELLSRIGETLGTYLDEYTNRTAIAFHGNEVITSRMKEEAVLAAIGMAREAEASALTTTQSLARLLRLENLTELLEDELSNESVQAEQRVAR